MTYQVKLIAYSFAVLIGVFTISPVFAGDKFICSEYFSEFKGGVYTKPDKPAYQKNTRSSMLLPSTRKPLNILKNLVSHIKNIKT